MTSRPEQWDSIVAELVEKAKEWDAVQSPEYDILLMEQFLEDECVAANYFNLDEDQIIDLKVEVAGEVFGWCAEWTVLGDLTYKGEQ